MIPTALLRGVARPLPAVAALLVFAAAVAGCRPASSARSTPADKPLVALVMKSLANEFFTQMADGAKRHQAANAARYELVVNGTKNETDLAEQVSLVEQMVARGAKAIVIAPADSQALVPALRRAHDAGVLVINIDNQLDAAALQAAGLTIPFVGPDNRDGARRVGEAVLASLPAGAKVAVIEGVPTAFNGQQRRKGFEDAIQARGAKLVGVQSGQWEMDRANQVAAAFLGEHPDLAAILCGNDSMALGAMAAIQAAGRTGKVLVGGFDNIPAIRQGIANRAVVATADQHGDQLAVFGIEAALSVLAGQAKAENRVTPVDVVTAESLR